MERLVSALRERSECVLFLREATSEASRKYRKNEDIDNIFLSNYKKFN